MTTPAEKCLESCNDHNCVVSGSCKGVTAAPHTDHPARHWDRTCPACNSPQSSTQSAELRGDEVETVERNPKSWAAWKRRAEQLERELAEANARAARWEENFHMSVHAPQTSAASATARSGDQQR